MSEQLIDRSAE